MQTGGSAGPMLLRHDVSAALRNGRAVFFRCSCKRQHLILELLEYLAALAASVSVHEERMRS